MVGKEHALACFIRLVLSFDRHTKQFIALQFQVQHKALCNKHKSSTYLEEANVRYVVIQC
jgi:hypothetical protein